MSCPVVLDARRPVVLAKLGNPEHTRYLVNIGSVSPPAS